MASQRGFIPDPIESALSLFRSAHFYPRSELETDASRKQLIPYVILRFRDQIFAYSRGTQSSEKRLVSNWSIGLGGHIEWHDDSLFLDPIGLYRHAARREVLEEVAVRTSYNELIVGLLNDDSNDVGRVHLGIVHVWDLETPDVAKRERKIRDSGFIDIDSLVHELATQRRRFETWSELLLRAFADEAIPPWEEEPLKNSSEITLPKSGFR